MNNQRDFKYLIYLLFVLSGISGLVYQIVWTRMLVLVFGNTMLAMSTVLSAFMGGLAAGSYVLGKYIDNRPRPLIKVYSMLEAGIGIFALFFPLLLDIVTPMYANLYTLVEGNIVLLNLFRFGVCFVLIGLPTFLMGGTLPILIKRFTSSGDSIGYQTGFLYGLNTVGAVLGTFATGYFLLRVLGMQKTTWVAVAINLGVAMVAWFLSRKTDSIATNQIIKKSSELDVYEDEQKYGKSTILTVLIGIGLSGFCALSYEVFWTRMLNLFLHNNIYSFTAILATFLIGIAVGSLIYAKFLSKRKNQVGIFIALQIGIGLISYLTPFIFKLFHSTLFNNFNETLTLAKTAAIMIGPTIMMGIAVPLAIQICRRGSNFVGTSVGTVYAANTVGAIVGAFTAGFILLPLVGLHKGIIIVASLNILAGFLPLIASAKRKLQPVWGITFVVVIVALVLPAPTDLFKDLFQAAHPNSDIAYYKEGKIANVLVYDFKKLGYKDFHLNAVNEASSRLWHVQLFKMLGLLPTLVHDEPTDALMVAFGAGMSAGASARNVESLDVVDLNPDIAGIAETFTRENLDVINQPNFNQIVNDGRNALMLNDRKYSLIISDATNPKMFDSWTLFSQEFYQLVKNRLKPDGVFCQWALIPLPGDALNVILNTFRSVFPHMSFWVIHGSSQVLMLATPNRLEIDYDTLKKRLEPFYEDAGLADYGIDSIEKFLSFFILGEDGATKMLDGFEKISTDDMPHAQFHIEQDTAGINNSMDLIRYQESILSYMKNRDSLPLSFEKTMHAYEDIARRLNAGYLKTDRLMFAEAAVVADNAGLNDANVAHHLNHCPEKKRYFQERISLYPDDFTAHNWLGNIYMLDGELDIAKKEFNKTISLKPDHAFAKMNLALTNLQAGDIDEAIDGLLEVREIYPMKGIVSSVDLQLTKAHLLRKLKFQPDSVLLKVELGKVYYKEGDILNTVRTFREAIQLSNNDESIILSLIQICENHGFVDEAVQLLEKLAKAQPENQQYIFLKMYYDKIQNDSSAFRDFQATRYKNLSSPEITEKKFQTHPSTCDEALALWNDLDADGSSDKNNLLVAAGLYEQSTITNPEDLHAYIDAGILYEVLGKYTKAATLWDQAYKISSDNKAYKMHSNRLNYLALLSRNEMQGSEKAELLRSIGNQFRAIGQLDKALGYFQRSVALDSLQVNSWLDLAETSNDVGLYYDAISAADNALSIQHNIQSAIDLKNKLEKIIN